jgi:hypothetical protein
MEERDRDKLVNERVREWESEREIMEGDDPRLPYTCY